MKALPPLADHDRLEPVAEADGGEPPAAGRIDFPDENDAVR